MLDVASGGIVSCLHRFEAGGNKMAAAEGCEALVVSSWGGGLGSINK